MASPVRAPRLGSPGEDPEPLADPEVRLALTGRSGPLVVEIEYRLHRKMHGHFILQEVQFLRQRSGG
ncbi:MFS transporter [Bradyrhizobium brasilense]|uniref:MFS transporter n=1 Tax=Bradyrhizobium brasilense TaxID=1419277 RepID=UPI001E576AA1|nr:MFS transporter [Bradyrhizobium brasilense]MCC8969145.1 hypothetical protein [Bradyrhizobium brasilense]